MREEKLKYCDSEGDYEGSKRWEELLEEERVGEEDKSSSPTI